MSRRFNRMRPSEQKRWMDWMASMVNKVGKAVKPSRYTGFNQEQENARRVRQALSGTLNMDGCDAIRQAHHA